MAADDDEETDMPKYLLLKRYQGGPTHDFPMLNEWEPEEVDAHMEFQHAVSRELTERGEFVDAQALKPNGTYVRYGGEGALPVTDGPFAETKELIAGWYIVDVDSEQRAHEIAAQVSSAPGPQGQPLYEWIEVRPFMDGTPIDWSVLG